MDSKRLQMIEMLHKIASLKNESECMLSCGYLFATPWTVAHQAPLSMGTEYWSELPCPSPGNLLNLGIKPRSPALQEDSLLSESPGKPKNTGVGSLSLLKGMFRT